jgi:MFS superfamily sulfate permease-like transporter
MFRNSNGVWCTIDVRNYFRSYGGIVVGFLSRSHISVSGPAAGLTAIILTAIFDFLHYFFNSGFIQLALGFIKAGSISNYFPTNVIEGMLAGIGVIIILKQIMLLGMMLILKETSLYSK